MFDVLWRRHWQTGWIYVPPNAATGSPPLQTFSFLSVGPGTVVLNFLYRWVPAVPLVPRTGWPRRVSSRSLA